MNDDLLRALMTDLDPVRDLTDDALSELLPLDHLTARVLSEVAQPSPVQRPTRTPVWRRLSVRVTSAAAAVSVVVIGAVSLFGSTPASPSWSFSAPLQVSSSQSPATQAQFWKASNSVYGSVSPAGSVADLRARSVVSGADVANGRFVKTVVLDHGALTISPAPSSLTSGMQLSSMEPVMWATSQLTGYSQQVIGFGLATLTKHTISDRGVVSAQQFSNVPSFIALATSSGQVYHCPAMTTHKKLPSLPSSGEAAVVVATPEPYTGPGTRTEDAGVVYTAASAPCGTLVPARLAFATEQVSIPWSQVGPVAHGQLPILVSTPPCGGRLSNYMVSGNAKSLTVTVKGLVYEGLFEMLCPRGRSVHEAIRLVPTGGESVVPIVTPFTKIVHALLGPIRATQS